MNPSQDLWQVDLTSLVYGGDAMGRLPDGRAVFVPYALPGEKVRVQLMEEKKGHARGNLVEVLLPSPERITPRCRHFSDCGGCHYQYLPYERQLEIKQSILREQLQRIANLSEAPVDPVVPSPNPWNYRNTLQFHLTADGKIGFQAADSHRVVAISECHLPEEALNETWPQLEFEPLAGLERVELRQGAGEELLLILEGDADQAPEFQTELRLSAVYTSGGEMQLLAGEEFIWMEVLDRAFKVSAGSFFQVNSRQAEVMIEHLLSILPLSPQASVLDLYCGVGLFSAFMAPRVNRCVGIEVSPWACDDFTINLDEFDNVELYVGAAETVLPGLEFKADMVVMDPPRSGVDKIVLDEMVKMKPTLIAYVSCDPATLARDTRRLLSGGYQLERVTPFDMFPQTYHIESISLFRFCP
jgi:23S rRNA (uracil1939-C5)-methyltransferase